MAKGGSESATAGLQGQECAGEPLMQLGLHPQYPPLGLIEVGPRIADVRRPAATGRSWGQSEPGDAGEGGKQPRQRRDGLVLPDDLGPASKTGRCNESESVAKPLNRRAGSNLVDMGRSAVHDHHGVVVDSDAGRSPRSGGHTESLRRRCGEAAGAQLDASPVDRRVVNVGTIPASPFPPPRQGGDGQVRRRLLMLGWDGALVVVRAPESGAHGEGGQRVRRLRCGMPGGRR